MKAVRKTPSEPTKPAPAQVAKKPKRVFMKPPLAKYVVYHDPHQWDEDITTGDSPQ